ncbi:hypothetical protein [Hydrogenophaga taeniospiralis]|uniref:hypothetical protein n=1 Tax=Hydrogenophaga taeniospiralis TaxID=65656 RepID=UPI000B210A66|nr:hypothetical protein [Hydrogenophaga taeniospiralis]
MDRVLVLRKFAENFVRDEFRERFIHEAMKKPRKLHARVCHEIFHIFDDKYKDGTPKIGVNEQCLYLGWSSEISELTWQEACEKMAGGGGGYLVISAAGTAFYAQTEGYPALNYAGHC